MLTNHKSREKEKAAAKARKVVKVEDDSDDAADQHDPKKCREALRLGSRCWAHFSSEVDNGRELFKRVNHEVIREAATNMVAENKGARYAKALKKLWSDADQDEWNRMAREHVDVFQYVLSQTTRPE